MVRLRHEPPGTLTWDQDLELLCGPGHIPGDPALVSNFASEEERESAWYAHRDRLLEWSRTGRPWALERYEG